MTTEEMAAIDARHSEATDAYATQAFTMRCVWECFDDIPTLLTALAEAQGALHALIDAPPRYGPEGTPLDYTVCAYCHAPEEHRPDCPIVRGRAVLEEVT